MIQLLPSTTEGNVKCNVIEGNVKATSELGSNNQEASPLAGKNNVIVLMPCRAWKYARQ